MEKLKARDGMGVQIIRGAAVGEILKIEGRYEAECRGADGELRWRDHIDNLVVTVGQNLMLDTVLAGSAYSVTGPYMGLISSVSYSAIAATDTMTSHPGWLEAGGANAPTYSGNRPTMAFSAASGGVKATSAAAVFNITGTGTIKGGFVVLGSGASNVVGNTGGVLLSAGLFTAGDKVVGSGDTVNVSWQLSL